MSEQIVNATPLHVNRGTQDLSRRQVPREAEVVPQHLPKFYIFAEKGPTTPELVVGSERNLMFGSETFNVRGKYANHATIFANLANENANACMLQRVIPADAGPEANMIVWLDVLDTTVDLYQRNPDGSIAMNNLGDPIITGTTDGYKVKWVVTTRTTNANMQNFGQADQAPGDQTDTNNNTQSTRYPIFELKASSKGSWGNRSGIRLSAPTTNSVLAMPTKMMSLYKAYPYFISVIRRPDEVSSPAIVETVFGEQQTMITFKEGVVNPLTEKQLYAGDAFIDSYQNLTDLRYPKLYGDFGAIHIYQDNIEALTTLFHAAEAPHVNQFSDFNANPDQKHLFNFVTGVSSYNVPYASYVFVDAVNSVRFGEYQNVYAASGSDGTLDNDTFESLVTSQMARYLDNNDEVQDLAYNVESIFYDSGFSLDAKYALCNAIAVRKDTFVVLGTHTVDGPVLTASEDNSLAIALRTRARMFPESDYFGTPVMRTSIYGQSGLLRNSTYKKRLPLTAQILINSAKYMGAGNGRWTNGKNFAGAPGSILSDMYDISNPFIPASVRLRNWDAGLNWVQRYDRNAFQFPALKTVYDDDTSVLNSFFTAMAICQLNKILAAAWREFTGVDYLTPAQLHQRVNDFITAKCKDRFDGRFIIIPEAQSTDMDLLRGYSWTVPVKIGTPNMETVMTSYIQAYRAADLQS